VRLFTAVAIFVATVALLILAVAVVLDALSQRRAIGLALVKGPASVIALLLICLLLGGFSYWLSGKFIR
jgi:hypothetical protein